MSNRRHIYWAWLLGCITPLLVNGADQKSLSRAYQSLSQGRSLEALPLFQEYVREFPRDIQASLDLAGLLSQLNQHAEARQRLEYISQLYPDHEPVRFKLAVEQKALNDFSSAEALFRALLNSSNPAMAEACRSALGQLEIDQERRQRELAEQRVYELTGELKTQEVLEAIGALESERPLTHAIAMQRLYLLYNLGQFAEASERAEALASNMPHDTDLAFLRAELFLQLGRVADAKKIWSRIEEAHPGTYAADEAKRRDNATQSAQKDRSLERQIYELAEAGRHQEVIQMIDRWEVDAEPVPLAMEMQRLYALFNLNYFDVALTEAEKLAAQHPNAIDLSLLRAELLVKLEKPDEAKTIWERIESQVPGSAAALEARRRKEALIPPVTSTIKEQKIYDLATDGKHAAVVEAIAALETEEGSISMAMEKQRLHALHALGDSKTGLALAKALVDANSDDADLAFLRAEFLANLNRPEEARAIWNNLMERHAGTSIAEEAGRRLEENLTTPRATPDELRIFALASERKHGEVIAAVDQIEASQGVVTSRLQLQRLYALMATAQRERALDEAAKITSQPHAPPDIVFLQSELLSQWKRWEEASLLLRGIKRAHPDTPYYEEANRRLDNLPQIANLDRLHWGEAYAAGDYYGRFDALIGSGFVRYGTYLPKARWLQPHMEFKFVVDTESTTDGRPTIISDNHVGHYAGARAQLFQREYVFLYAQAGVNRDLLDRRDDGDFAFDYQVGIYGFKSWGPGIALRQPEEQDSQLDGGPSSLIQTNGFFWRGDWFVDTSLNFSYYHRYGTWLGYASAREGFRLFQIGPRVAFDSYLVQNLAWDVAGNYFDNLFEVGPGARWIWTPCPHAQIVLRAEWHYGGYLGRSDDQQGAASGSYDEIVAGLSVGMRW